jgi:hypothetical protein
MSATNWFCRMFCRRTLPENVDRGELPPEVRRLSHNIANKAASIQSAANEIRRDVMLALAEGMQRDGHSH